MQRPEWNEKPLQNPPHKRKKRRGRLARFMRGYLMIVGALTSLYVLAQLVVLLLVEIAKWQPTL